MEPRIDLDLPAGTRFAMKRVFIVAQTSNPSVPGGEQLQGTRILLRDGTNAVFADFPTPLAPESVVSNSHNFAGNVDLPWTFKSGETIQLQVLTIDIASIIASVRVVGELIPEALIDESN